MSENTINTQITQNINKEIDFYRGMQVFISIILVIVTLIIGFILLQSKFFQSEFKSYKLVHIGYILATLIFSIIIIIEYFENIIRTLENKKNNFKIKSNDNRLGMDNLIKDINSYFDEIKKEIVYQDNKYTNIIEDNNDKINELMDILFNRDNNFITNIINPDISDISNITVLQEFYDLIKNKNYSLGNIYELKNSELYKICIKSIHHKIFLYNIHQTEFIKTLYEFIENVDFNNVEDPISITKFELLANYKILINNIYDDLKVNNTYSDINKKGYINNLKFCKIYSNFSYDNLNNKITGIQNINNDINTLHTDYEHLIRYEFNKYKNIQNYYYIFKNYIITMSSLFLVGLIFDLYPEESNNNNNNNKNNKNNNSKNDKNIKECSEKGEDGSGGGAGGSRVVGADGSGGGGGGESVGDGGGAGGSRVVGADGSGGGGGGESVGDGGGAGGSGGSGGGSKDGGQDSIYTKIKKKIKTKSSKIKTKSSKKIKEINKYIQDENTNLLKIITGFLSNVVLVVFFNVLIISKYNKYKVRNNYNEKLYDLNKEKFSDFLIHNENSYVNNLKIIKDLELFLDVTPRKDDSNFEKIKYSNSDNNLTIEQNNVIYKEISTSNSDDETIYYYYDSTKKILLDDEELLYTHILELYKNNIALINHYNCCSYVNNYKKEVIFPWDEISINVIIFMIIIVIIGTIYKTNGEYNVFEKLQILKEKKIKQIGSGNANTPSSGSAGNAGTGNSGKPGSANTTSSNAGKGNGNKVNNEDNELKEIDLTDSEFIKNMVIIYVFGFYSYRIFSNSLTYYKNYEYIN